MISRRIGEQSSEPSVAFAVVLLLATSLLAIAVAGPGHYLERVQAFPDMSSYAEAARAVRGWQLAGVPVRQFWGFPYAGAVASFLMPGVPMLVVLAIVSAIAACVAATFVHRLWGGWVAVYCTALGWPWIQRVAFGGSEPLFLALALGALLAARRERWLVAALLAALATTVRPVGVFVLAGVLGTALWRRRPGAAAAGAGIAAGVFAAYVGPLAFGVGDALANVHWYGPQFTGGMVLGMPFLALWRGTRTNVVSPLREIGWIGALGVALVPAVAWFVSRPYREDARRYPAEPAFALSYALFLITFNCPPCAWSLPRFAILSLPFALAAVRPLLPRDDRVLTVLAMLSAVIAAAMQIDERAPGAVLLRLVAHQ